MASQFKISIDLDLPSDAPVNQSIFPKLFESFAAIVAATQEKWVSYAKGEPLPSGLRIGVRSGNYSQSIAVKQNGPLNAEVYSNIAYASKIEEGSPARDLHELLATSNKTRINSKGKRYLIISFRWGSPGTVTFGKNVMPESVHKGWLSGAFGGPSRVTGTGTRLSATGHSVTQHSYQWGGRLTQPNLTALGIGTEFHGKTYQTHPMAGMVQMRNPGSAKGSKHSSYFTFRTLSEGSPGWLVPAIEGKWPARTTAELIQPIAEKVLAEAAEADIRMWGAAA